VGMTLRIWNDSSYLEDRKSKGNVTSKFGTRSIKRDTVTMGHIHVCSGYVDPCEDPEDQIVLSIGSEGSGNFSQGGMSRTGSRSNFDAHVLPTLNYKHVVEV
jgi:hypothetical protein